MTNMTERRTRSLALPAAMLLGLSTSVTAFVVPNFHMTPRHHHIQRHSHTSQHSCNTFGRASSYTTTRLLVATLEESPVAVTDIPATDSSDASFVSPPAAAAVGEEEAVGDYEVRVTKPMAEIKVGEMLQGTVDNIVEYGAFVDVGAEINGLVHVSQLSNEFVSDPNTVVSVGQTVTVKVVDVNPENRKLVLTMRTKERAAPREQKDVTKYAELFEQNCDAVYDVVIRNVVQYGVFAEMEEDITGFCHITQMRDANNGRIRKLDDVVKIGDEMKVKIRGVDTALKRINLTSLLEEKTVVRTEKKDCAALLDYDRSVPHKAKVSGIIDYGAFLDMDGVEGLLHVSKLREGQVDVSELNDLTVGQEVDAYILNVDTDRQQVSFGLYQPSPGPGEADYERLLEIPRDEFIEGTVVSVMEYGAFVHVGGGVDGMVHISELLDGRPGPATVGEVVTVGDKVNVRVMDVNVRDKRVRLSMRSNQAETRKPVQYTNNAAPWVDFPSDQWVEGEVVRLADFGAFVRIADDCDALCHVSQLSDERVENVSDVVQVGQKVQVRIIEVDPDQDRVGVSMRDGTQSRRGGGGGGGRGREKKDVSEFANFDETEFFEGTVRSTTSFGAFIDIGGVDGLVHISQISDERVEYVEDVLSPGDVVQVRIIDVNEEAGTVGLSMKAPYGGGGGGYARQQEYEQDEEQLEGERQQSRPQRRQRAPRPSAEEEGGASEGKEDWRNYLDTYVTDKTATLSEKYALIDDDEVDEKEEEEDEEDEDNNEIDESDYKIVDNLS